LTTSCVRKKAGALSVAALGGNEMSDDDWSDLFGYHARRSDPDTSHEAAASIDVTQQARRILRSYRDGQAILDIDAYRRAGFPPHACDGQRCSDLRQLGMIERTGERGTTPSGKSGYLCRITRAGLAYLALHEQ
jgi:hypothetical protein